MSKQISIEQNYQEGREAVDAYHRRLMDLIHFVCHWAKPSNELMEFLDHNGDLLHEPIEFQEFYEIFRSVLDMSALANCYQRYDDQKKAKIILRALLSEPRTRHYSNIINDRLRRKPTEKVELVSLLELEQRYQHYLYKKGRNYQGLGFGPVFKAWVKTPNCQTFFDQFEY